MTKDIFSDEYFAKHRDNSSWDNYNSKNISKMLNLKHKPRPKLDDIAPEKIIKKIQTEPVIDQDFKEVKKTRISIWKKDYLKAVIAGICGGLIFYLVQLITSSENLFSSNFVINTFIIFLVGLIFIIIFGVVFKITDDRM